MDYSSHRDDMAEGNQELLDVKDLEQLIQQEFLSDKDPDVEYLRKLTDALHKKRNHPSADANQALDLFQKVYLPERENGTSAQQKPSVEKRKRPLRLRVLLVAAIMAAVLLGTLMVAQAVGIDVFGAIARWTDETFWFSAPEDEAAAPWFADRQEELDFIGLSEEFLPSWIPEGYTLEGDIQLVNIPGQTEVYAVFSNADHSTFDILVAVYDNPVDIETQIFEKDDSQVQICQVNGKTVYLFYNLGLTNAVFQYQNIVYSVVGDLSQEMVLDLFNSIGDD